MSDAIGQVLANIYVEACDPLMQGVMLFLGTDDFHHVIHQVILARDQFKPSCFISTPSVFWRH